MANNSLRGHGQQRLGRCNVLKGIVRSFGGASLELGPSLWNQPYVVSNWHQTEPKTYSIFTRIVKIQLLYLICSWYYGCTGVAWIFSSRTELSSEERSEKILIEGTRHHNKLSTYEQILSSDINEQIVVWTLPSSSTYSLDQGGNMSISSLSVRACHFFHFVAWYGV